MNEVLLMGAILMVLIVFMLIIWIVLENKKLKQGLSALQDEVERNNKDIAGLCSAAVSVDNRLTHSREKLKGIAEEVTVSSEKLRGIVDKVTGLEQHEQQDSSSQPQSYHHAIKQIHNGANEDELIKQCGLSRDEAVLLIRLHGQQK